VSIFSGSFQYSPTLNGGVTFVKVADELEEDCCEGGVGMDGDLDYLVKGITFRPFFA
jgi:hypothetical protein